MNVTRSLAIAATCAAVSVGAAAPASAAAEMSGHYIATATAPGAAPITNDWYFTPCGDGCADMSNPTGHGGRAMSVNGQWTMDTTSNIGCNDGTTTVPDAASAHYTWDPNTLAGTAQLTLNTAACGQPAGYTFTNNIQLRQAP